MLKRLVAEGILTREEAQTGSVVDDDGCNHEPGAKKVSKATRAFNEFDNMIRCKYDGEKRRKSAFAALCSLQPAFRDSSVEDCVLVVLVSFVLA